MGITGSFACPLIKELTYKPLPKTIHLLGRQTIHFGFHRAVSLLRKERIEPVPVEPRFDERRLRAAPRSRESPPSRGKSLIRYIRNVLGKSDIDVNTFFRMLGAETIHGIDHSDYQGADIIVDLTRDVPKHFHDTADFIFDGSVMDNIFDPAAALRNVSRILKAEGRYFGFNVISNKIGAYIAFSPQYFFDYFAINNFRDVKIYVLDFYNGWRPEVERETLAECHVYKFHLGSQRHMVHGYNGSEGVSLCMVIAEKGTNSSSDEHASQGIYRSDQEWKIFGERVNSINSSERPDHRYGCPTGTEPMEVPGFEYVGSMLENGKYKRRYGSAMAKLRTVARNSRFLQRHPGILRLLRRLRGPRS